MRLLVSILATLFALPALAQTYSVTGVAADDVLNIRAEIYACPRFADAPVVGALPPGAAGITATGRSFVLDGATWREVRHEGVTGWVHTAYLQLETLFPADAAFDCSGTERFWDVRFDDAGGTARQLGDETTAALTTRDWSGAEGRPDVRQYRMDRGDGAEMTAIVAAGRQCSDGMSDFGYAYTIFLLGLRPGALHAGCCILN